MDTIKIHPNKILSIRATGTRSRHKCWWSKCPFVNWGENNRYDVGQYVKYNDQFYATETAHLSTETFDLSKFVKLVELPNRRWS